MTNSKIYPQKLKKGDVVRVIAPARSLKIISQNLRDVANSRFKELELEITFGKHVEENDDSNSTTIENRASDLHEAFADKSVKAVLTVIGGFNSNQLLDSIDWNLIKNNPKIFCGFSDITILNNAIFTKTGLVTYSGPHYSTFGQKLYFDYTLDYFKKCLLNSEEFSILPSTQWSDDEWYINQENRQMQNNEGFWVINEGRAEGTILGANLNTLNLLNGTEFAPDLTNSILFIEDTAESQPHHFDRDLQSLIYQPGFSSVRGLVIGRFQQNSHMTFDLLSQIIKAKKQLNHIPIIGNVDFGHTDPKITFPIGGTAMLSVSGRNIELKILEH